MASNTSSMSAMSEDEFVKELVKDPKKDWYTMGCLLGLYEHTVKDIMIEHHLTGGIEDCLREIYKALLKQRIKLTWEKIIDALSTAVMNNGELAEEINRNYCGGSYRSPHGTDEEEKRDNEIAKFLINVCEGKITHQNCTSDEDMFYLVNSIRRTYKRQDISNDDVRRVVASRPELKLDKGPGLTTMKIRANAYKFIKKEESLYHFMSTICRFGDDELPQDPNDGSVNVAQLLELKKWVKCDEEDARKAVKYTDVHELILVENPSGLRIKHITIHPPPLGPTRTGTAKFLWSDVRSCCCKAGYKKLSYDIVEGYLQVSEVVAHLRKQSHNKDITEQDVINIVKNTPPNCEKEWLILKEQPTLQVKATWGHTMEVERPYTTPTLTVDKVPPFACQMIYRKQWVKHKKGLFPTDRYRIELHYKDQPLKDEQDILREYGHHQVIVEIDLVKAIEDGLEFHLQPPRIIICMEESIPEKYMKRIL